MVRVDRAGVGLGLERAPHPQRRTAVDIPDAQGLVVARGVQMPVVGADAQHVALVAFDAAGDGAGVEIPQQDAPVARYRCAAMFADEAEILDVVAVPEQPLQARTAAQIPEEDAVVGRHRRGAQSVRGDHDPVDQMIVMAEQGHRAAVQIEARHRAVVGRCDDLPRVRDPRGGGDRSAMASEIEGRRGGLRSVRVCRRHRRSIDGCGRSCECIDGRHASPVAWSQKRIVAVALPGRGSCIPPCHADSRLV
jgi:hypothetical protein